MLQSAALPAAARGTAATQTRAECCNGHPSTSIISQPGSGRAGPQCRTPTRQTQVSQAPGFRETARASVHFSKSGQQIGMAQISKSLCLSTGTPASRCNIVGKVHGSSRLHDTDATTLPSTTHTHHTRHTDRPCSAGHLAAFVHHLQLTSPTQPLGLVADGSRHSITSSSADNTFVHSLAPLQRPTHVVSYSKIASKSTGTLDP